ncbi:PEPxxWA-CTERM sorting domain-containing protein [Sphingomonas sp. GV3]|jgi:hypothetical protein|uniref:PEPxxWA-CTERM sorting domain-containing protein n=1 Tax=Sphingomonas sp. GV3 TaxID=3040671 RepID=UPI00280B01FD|nr:PEPxxWA-CTERM sorting domain-containing protein [Sphingomonas sp. GV3]
MKTLKRVLTAAALIGGTALSMPASAANLVTNGSFETGDFTGYTANGNFLSVQTNPFAGISTPFGTHFAALGTTPAAGGTLSQTLTTIAGWTYTLSYYLASDGGTPNFFNASWNGNVISGSAQTNIARQGFTQYQFNVTGTGSDVLTFAERNNPGFLGLDNISVTAAVPEPATWALMILGMGAVGFAMRRSRKPKVNTTVSFA